MPDEPIELTHPLDLAFARMAQGALFNDTIMPSGYRTPPRDLVIDGTALVEPSDEQRRQFGLRGRPHRYH